MVANGFLTLNPTALPLLDSTVLNGVPSVVVRGSPTILQNSISGLIKGQVPNLPLIAEGLKIFNTLPTEHSKLQPYK